MHTNIDDIDDDQYQSNCKNNENKAIAPANRRNKFGGFSNVLKFKRSILIDTNLESK
jgi:hypothetical protein